ncbi:hypothetical protein [Terriglobus sp.]|uniref:hypothetical protein n=1 Tax=Terriglobus sp. TaxID=1889013 RepID=UPI003AFFDE02
MQTFSEAGKRLPFHAEQVSVPGPWQAYVLRLERLPIPPTPRPGSGPDLRHDLREILDALEREVVASQSAVGSSLWLLLDQLHIDGAVRMIAKNGVLWRPSPGLGLWPDREPPRMWTSDDLLDRDYRTPIRELKHTVIHINADEEGSHHAWQTMFGTGGTIQLLHSGDAAAAIAHWQTTLQPTIQDEAFQAYPFTFPLLERRTVENRSVEDLDRWLGPVSFYMRESTEDSGILILSRTPLQAVLERLGLWVDGQTNV